jgi:hypothetical protein
MLFVLMQSRNPLFTLYQKEKTLVLFEVSSIALRQKTWEGTINIVGIGWKNISKLTDRGA